MKENGPLEYRAVLGEVCLGLLWYGNSLLQSLLTLSKFEGQQHHTTAIVFFSGYPKATLGFVDYGDKWIWV